MGTLGREQALFVLFAALISFTWGEIFSLFPAICTDTFGRRFAKVNAGLLYTAKGASAWLVPLANVLKGVTGRGVRGHGGAESPGGRAGAVRASPAA